MVYPMLAEVDAAGLPHSALAFVRLSQLLERDRIEDAHLLIALCRLAHALGVSPRSPRTAPICQQRSVQ